MKRINSSSFKCNFIIALIDYTWTTVWEVFLVASEGVQHYRIYQEGEPTNWENTTDSEEDSRKESFFDNKSTSSNF